MDWREETVSHSATAVSKSVRRGLAVLFTAYEYAVELNRDRWEFATEIAVLRDLGLTPNDFRWMTCKGLVEHAREVTMPHASARQFQPQGDINFSARTCFVLTEAGASKAARLRRVLSVMKHTDIVDRDNGIGGSHPLSVGNDAMSAQVAPHWNAACRELRFGPHLVKVFRVPSPNQETILTVFEEEGWPPRIDDPLPPLTDIFAKQRLHDAIKSLNRNQQKRLIRFIGDGTGQGVGWEVASKAEKTAYCNIFPYSG